MKKIFELMYERLATFLVENLNLETVTTVLEAGCGSGQLTIPFAKKLMKTKPNVKLIAYDLSIGPYEGDLDKLRTRVQKEGLHGLILPVNGDVRNMHRIEDESVDVIISNELFCELDRRGLEKTIKEFYRILKPGGQMAHGELMPAYENVAQKLAIRANAYSLATSHPKPDWFSPYSDQVVALMHKTGLKNITVKYFETNVKLGYKEAVQKLKQWNTNPSFIKKNLKHIKKHGIELPMEHIIFCTK